MWEKLFNKHLQEETPEAEKPVNLEERVKELEVEVGIEKGKSVYCLGIWGDWGRYSLKRRVEDTEKSIKEMKKRYEKLEEYLGISYVKEEINHKDETYNKEGYKKLNKSHKQLRKEFYDYED